MPKFRINETLAKLRADYTKAELVEEFWGEVHDEVIDLTDYDGSGTVEAT